MDNKEVKPDKENAKQLAKKGFLVLSKEKKEFIDFEEFQTMLKKLDIHLSSPLAKKLFEVGDVTHCGKITYKELKLVFRVHCRMVYKNYFTPYEAFMSFNEDGGDKLDIYEFFEAIKLVGIKNISERQAHDEFKKLDSTNENIIDYTQFVDFLVDHLDIQAELKKRKKEDGGDVETLRGYLMKEKEDFNDFENMRLLIEKEDIEKKKTEQHGSYKSPDLKKLLTRTEHETSRALFSRLKEQQDDKLYQNGKTAQYFQQTIHAKAVYRDRQEKGEKEVKEYEANEEILFKSLFNNSSIDLANRNLTHLPEEYYMNNASQKFLNNLPLINLSNNKITQLPDNGFFNNLSELLSLDISHNCITYLQPSICEMKNLIYCDISNNQLRSIPKEIGQCCVLEYLDLSCNKLTSISPVIASLLNLKYLNLSNNYIVLLPPIINCLNKLNYFNVSGNKLAKFPEINQEFEKLEILDISWNVITELPVTFATLKSIQQLNLSNNYIHILPEDFGKLSKLITLNLSHNGISTLDDELEINFKECLSLDLSHNDIRILPSNISFFEKLQMLDLSNNSLSFIPDSINQCKMLEVLKLRNNKLNTLPKKMNKLKYLTNLDLSFNQLKELSESLSSLVNLKYLSLSNNKIEKLPSNYCTLTFLNVFDISFNNITSIPNEYSNMISLRELICKRNLIKTIPIELCNLDQLKVLDLSANLLEGLPKEIGRMTQLEVLDLYHNKLQSLPVELTQLLPTLKVLCIGYNPLTVFPVSWANKWHLQDQTNLCSDVSYLESLNNQLSNISDIYNVCVKVWNEESDNYINGKTSFQHFIERIKAERNNSDLIYRNIIEIFYSLSKANGEPITYEQLSDQEKRDIVEEEMKRVKDERVKMVKNEFEKYEEKLNKNYSYDLDEIKQKVEESKKNDTPPRYKTKELIEKISETERKLKEKEEEKQRKRDEVTKKEIERFQQLMNND